MNEEEAREHNRAALLAVAVTHGPEILDKISALVKERAETFPDRSRKVVWLFDVHPDGTVTLEVQP